MTWVEALPTVGVMLALLWGIKESRKIDKRMDYRGILDKRVRIKSIKMASYLIIL